MGSYISQLLPSLVTKNTEFRELDEPLCQQSKHVCRYRLNHKSVGIVVSNLAKKMQNKHKIKIPLEIEMLIVTYIKQDIKECKNKKDYDVRVKCILSGFVFLNSFCLFFFFLFLFVCFCKNIDTNK